jgi:hypothetical protein
LDFVCFLACYFSQGSEEFDFDLHRCSDYLFSGQDLFYSMPHFSVVGE